MLSCITFLDGNSTANQLDTVQFSGLASGRELLVGFVSADVGNSGPTAVNVINQAASAIHANNLIDLNGTVDAPVNHAEINNTNVSLTGATFHVVGTNADGIAQAGQDRGVFGAVHLLSKNADTFQAGNNNEYVNAGAANDTVTGGTGNDFLVGGAGSDMLAGGAGNDTLLGGVDADSLQGNDGNDVFVYTAVAELVDTVAGGADTDTIRLSTGTNAVSLTNANFANVTQMEVLALAGTGTQSVTLSGNVNGAYVDGITVTTVPTATSLNLDGKALTVSLNATGTNFDDTIKGGSVNDSLVGGAGNDILTGLGGDDTIVAGEGNDTIAGGFGADTINLTEVTAAQDLILVGTFRAYNTGLTCGPDETNGVSQFATRDKITGFGVDQIAIAGFDGTSDLLDMGVEPVAPPSWLMQRRMMWSSWLV